MIQLMKPFIYTNNSLLPYNRNTNYHPLSRRRITKSQGPLNVLKYIVVHTFLLGPAHQDVVCKKCLGSKS